MRFVKKRNYRDSWLVARGSRLVARGEGKEALAHERMDDRLKVASGVCSGQGAGRTAVAVTRDT